MHISLTNTGKRFNREWIFRHVDYSFLPGRSYAITGANGAGKSTLLQVIAGAVMHSEGNVTYTPSAEITKPGTDISYLQISIAAPYLELIEEMTATEFLHFHATFKALSKSSTEILEEVGLGKAAHKQLRYFSSGMKQRLKLAQAIFSNTSAVLLDEPTTNLDAEGIRLYQKLIASHSHNRLVIISSNDPQEYEFCKEVISIGDYK